VDDAQAVLESCGELDGVVFLNGLQSRHDSLDPTGEQALLEITAFAKALEQRKTSIKPRAYVVTQAAFSTNEHDGIVQPAQSALNGFVRVAFNELDGLQFSSIDLPSKCNADTIDSLALELLCDSIHDEVAIRGTMRLTSELNESQIISEDRIEYIHLDDDHPIQVRALRPDLDSIGTARMLAVPLAPLDGDAVHIRIEASIVPSSLLLDPTADTIDQALVEFVGEVLSIGPGVSDLKIGMRLCGFAPADIASHITVSRSSLYVTEVAPTVDASLLVSALGMATKAERVADCLDLQPGEKALLEWSPLSLAIADSLRRKEVPVTFLADAPEEIASSVLLGSAVYSRCPVGIAHALRDQTSDLGFSVLVAGLRDWTSHLDFHAIHEGASLVDTDEKAQSIVLPTKIGTVVRTDCRVLFQKRAKLEQALRAAIALIQAGTIAGSPVLEVSVTDLAWQKLPLSDTSSTLVITFETRGKDLPVVQRDELTFASNGTYLVTGGFGGFGQKTAEWLAANGAGCIVLTGRTGADTKQRQAFVKHLEAMGAIVHAAACDTSNRAQLQDLFAEIKANMPPLKGVFHSGALILDQPITEIDSDTLGKVMQSKALGAWNLHLLTLDLDLDHFVLYSSIANLVGNSRQAAYSAANGFLNGLAAMRNAMGLAGTSVNWGAISDVGVVAQDEKLEQFLRYTGLRGISSKEGLDVLGVGLVRRLTQLGITMITSWADWARFETRGAKSPRFASLIASDSQVKDHSIRDALIEELSQLENADQVELLGGLIVEVIASVLKSDPSTIPLDCSINQLGVDSLMATEIQLLFDSKLGLTISILELIGEATVRSIATQSLKTLMGDPNRQLVPMVAS
jgi:NADP-dependent 3-hydroxy acid dehydrogenase YdfG/acyl carrier protein